MTIEECYRMLGGDYAEVLRRLTAPSLIRRFIAKFPQDHTLEQLCAAVEAGNRADTVAVIDMYLASDPSDGTGGRGDIQA